MRMVSPDIGLPEVTLAQDQHEYIELTASVLHFNDGSQGLLTRWRLSEEEKQRLVDGEDLFVTLLTFGQPMQPVHISVGRPDYLDGDP